jgi:nucleotide-binding universal stress UspA family protein
MKVKKILWPTDFSEPSYEALKVAEEMASMHEAELYLVHIIPPQPLLASPPECRRSFDVSEHIDDLRMSAETSLQDVIDKKIGGKLKTKSLILHGDAAGEISRIADKEKVDLIIIASHGKTGWKRNLVGSVTEKLVRICTVPMRIIRHHNNHWLW